MSTRSQLRFGKPDRAEMDRETLGKMNQQAHRIANDTQGGATRAALSRRLAEKVANGCELVDAVLETAESAREDAGVIVPIGEVPASCDSPDVNVTIEPDTIMVTNGCPTS